MNYLTGMKRLLFPLLALAAATAGAQPGKQELAKATASAERTALLEALKQKLQPGLRQKPKLVVTKLTVMSGYAYFAGRAKASDGKDIDFRKTAYKEDVEQGVFDGDGTNALLKKTGGKWKVLAYVIGPTDVPWGCWWKEFKAPKEIFDYTETSCDWVK